MYILYDINNNCIYDTGDTVTEDESIYSVTQGKSTVFWAKSDNITIIEVNKLEVPEDFYQTTDKYRFDPENLTIIPNPDYVPPLEDRLTDIVNKLAQIQESQDNQDTVLAALLELL